MYSLSSLGFLLILFISNAVPSYGQDNYKEEEHWYNITRNITLVCPLTVSAGQTLLWFKEHENQTATLVSEDPTLKDRYSVTENSFVIGKSIEDDYGYYLCKVGSDGYRFFVRGVQRVKLPENTVVVEDEDLKLVCNIHGKPFTQISWYYVNGTNEKELLEDNERIILEKNDKGAENGKLIMKNVKRSEAGVYVCEAKGTEARTDVKVRDKYAAVWPFLGIVAEVLILCVIILVYEKRRTKPEMEDSDTEHDQKQS